MIYLNWQLTLAIVIIAPVMGVLIGWFGERLRKYSLKSQNRVSDLSAILTEVFSGIRLVQAFAAEDFELAKFSYEAERSLKAKYSAEKLKAVQIPIVGFLEALSALSLILVGTWQISQGNLTVANFFSYLAAAALLIDPIGHTTHNYNEFKQGEASVDRVFELLAIQPTVLEKPDAIHLPPVEGKIEYRHITFSYKPGEPILKDINLIVKPGEAIALVGASGAGKSTFVNLLPRFYDPEIGEILIDGVNIRDVKLHSLRRQIGIVPQETIMFSGTIADNIAFGQDNFDLQLVEEAAKIANAHQFISQLPEGYNTWVGERGVNLSGGQRQRIAIARAVLLNPQILILDEATSALDSESEALVQEALERLMENRTVLIIAHRLSTVRKCDRILVLEKGQIVESGTHEELLNLERRYARFYTQQFS
jgi:ATP-binding cassette subfamily B protein